MPPRWALTSSSAMMDPLPPGNLWFRFRFCWGVRTSSALPVLRPGATRPADAAPAGRRAGTYGVMRVKVRLVELVSADLTQVK